MKDGTREDYELLEHPRARLLADASRPHHARTRGTAERARRAIRVTRLEHSLQAATRARRDGADNELIVAALIHDIGDDLAPFNHAEIAARLLRPVSCGRR